MLHIILHQSLSYPEIGRPLISHYFDKRDLQRISRTKQRISQVTLPALQRISQAKHCNSQVTFNQSINSFLFPHSITLETHVYNNKYWPSAEKGTRSKRVPTNNQTSDQSFLYQSCPTLSHFCFFIIMVTLQY